MEKKLTNSVQHTQQKSFTLFMLLTNIQKKSCAFTTLLYITIIYHHSLIPVACMAFWPRSYTQCVLPLVTLGTASLKFVVEAVYLGHIISSNLKDDSDI